jgi:hypothetical protein
VVRIWWYVTGTTHSLLPDAHSAPRFQFVWQLYHCSHSLLVFAAVFGLVWAILGRPVLEMVGWALHILIDVLTHKGIFAVHFLWPLSNYGFNGIRWEERWFLALNYAALLAVLAWLWVHARKKSAGKVASNTCPAINGRPAECGVPGRESHGCRPSGA